MNNVYTYRPNISLREFDLGGVLYHARYFHLFEECREAFLAENETPYPSLVAEGSHLAVAESHLSFLRPITYGQEIRVEMTVSELKKVSATLAYVIRDNEGNNLHEAWTKLVFVHASNGSFRPAPFPDKLRLGFEKLS